jgi:hypothetical protein
LFNSYLCSWRTGTTIFWGSSYSKTPNAWCLVIFANYANGNPDNYRSPFAFSSPHLILWTGCAIPTSSALLTYEIKFDEFYRHPSIIYQ